MDRLLEMILFGLMPRWMFNIIAWTLGIIGIIGLLYFWRAGIFGAMWDHGFSHLFASLWKFVQVIWEIVVYIFTGHCDNGKCSPV